MKKYLFIFSVATLGFAACSNDDVVAENNALGQQPKEIAFMPLTTPQTRAAVHGTTFPDQDMYVAAYMAAPAANVGNYFAKTTFKKNYQGGSSSASDNIWGGSPARYWPLSAATINFLAVTAGANPADEFTFDATNYANTATVAYTAANGYSNSSQVDVMYAVGQGVVSQSNNTLSFAGGGTGENVAMTFYHAMALLNFQVKANSTTEVNKIKINSITVNGASYTGSLLVTNANYAATTTAAKTQPKITWTPEAATSAVVTGISNYTLASKDNYYPDNSSAWANIMIIPSDTEGGSPTARGFRSFTINYTVLAGEGETDQTYDYTYYPSGNSSADFNVTEGKIYTYQINFKLHEIRIQPVVTDWTDATSYPSSFDVQ